MRQPFLVTIGVFLGVTILINLLIDNPTFNKLSDKAHFELQANQTELAEKTLFQIVLQDSLNIENHYHYISTHFDIPERKRVGKNNYEYRDDKTIQDFYNSLAQSADSNLADIGLYGKGLIQVHFEKYSFAISEFQQVKNKNLNYLNNSIGNAYNQIDSTDLAEKHFRKEIESNGNLEGAYSNLLQLLFDQNRTDELNTYLKNPEIKKFFPSRVERAIYFKAFKPIEYGTILFNRIFSGLNIWGAIAALLILCSWTMYLRKLDIFEVEKWRHIIITLLLGMLFSFLTYPLSDFDNLIFGFKLNGGLINDFFYSVIGIGAIEEFVKIVPLLLLMRFTKAVNEPFDYIKYASLSALGFAFVENLIYFNESNLHIIHGRALTAVVSHMFDSSIIAYGIILNKYKRQKNTYINFLVFFAIASVSHGFYDFWLINNSAKAFNILTIIYLLVSMHMWNSFKNNALNHSNFFDKDKSIDSRKLQDYLLYSLVGILLFEYIALAIKFSPNIANNAIYSSFISGTYLVLFLRSSLTKFWLNQGEWAPIKYWSKDDNSDLFDDDGKQINSKILEKVVGFEIKITNFTNNEFQSKYLPNTGKIIRRLTISSEPDWYLVKLQDIVYDNYHLGDLIIIKTKDRSELIKQNTKRYISFFLVPSDVDLDSLNLNRTDIRFCGWAIAE